MFLDDVGRHMQKANNLCQSGFLSKLLKQSHFNHQNQGYLGFILTNELSHSDLKIYQL